MFAGLRELLRHPAFRYAIPGILFLTAAAYLFFQFGTSPYPPGISERAYFTTDETAVGDAAVKALFADSVNKIPPFDYDGKPACRAMVYTGAGRKMWVNHLVRYEPKTKQKLETEAADKLKKGIKTGPDFGAAGESGMEIKRPGPGPWLKSSAPEFENVMKVNVPEGVQPADVDIGTP